LQLLGLILVLINIGAVVGPVAGVGLMYQDNLVGLVVPPEVEKIVSETLSNSMEFELPKYLDSTYDVALRTASIRFSFVNPFNFDLSINSVSANVECTQHQFHLGQVAFGDPVELKMDQEVIIVIVFSWSQVAEAHFLNEHPQASSVAVDLTNIVIDVSGITVETPERVSLPLEIPLPN
jgi:hypothetical protein